MKKLALSALAIGALSLSVACGGDDDNGVILPDAAPNIDAPASNVCNAIMNTGCEEGFKCGLRRLVEDDDTTPHTTECVPDGTVAIGAACEYAPDPNDATTEYDNCQASAGQGVVCSGGLCTETCAAGVLGSCPDRADDAQACVGVNRHYDDQATPTGLCVKTCDPVERTSCQDGDGCFPLFTEAGTDFICFRSLAPDPPAQAGEECPLINGSCFLNAAAPGTTIGDLVYGDQASPIIILPFCSPIDTSTDADVSPGLDPIATANGIDGAVDTLGNPLECVTNNFASGELVGGPGTAPGFGCRFINSMYTNTANVAATVGWCIPVEGFATVAGASGNYGECSGWSLDAFVIDATDNMMIDDPANIGRGCVSDATLEAAFPQTAVGRRAYQAYKDSLPKLPKERLNAVNRRK